MILEAIRQEKERRTDMNEPLKIQDYLNTWKEVRIWRPRRSIGGIRLYPGQKVWRYEHTETHYYQDCDDIGIYDVQSEPSFYLYLTNEEYVMAKMSI